MFQNQYQIGAFHRADAVGDGERSASVHDKAHAATDQVIGFRIDGGGGIIQDQDAGIGQMARAMARRWR